MSGPDPYDASEVAERRPSQYFSRRDLRHIILVFCGLLIALWPVYCYVKKQTEDSICKKNLQAIVSALGSYMEDTEGHYPAVFATNGMTRAPFIDEAGLAVTWSTAIAPHVNSLSSFTCPSAAAGEHAGAQGYGGRSIHTTYGLYAPYSTELQPGVVDPGRTIIIAETSNFGANNTYDPLKFLDRYGNPVRQDGFAIGFDDAQLYPTSASRSVTRLAFANSASGKFGGDADGRHNGRIHALAADGSLVVIGPGRARFQLSSPGYWAVPPRPGR